MRYAPRALLCRIKILKTSFFYFFTFLLFYLYKVQLVTPSVVAMAVRTEIAICKIVFQVFTFIIFILMLNVDFFNVEC